MSNDLNRGTITNQMRIVNDVTASWKSQVLFVLLKLGVFDLLENNPRDSRMIAEGLSVPEDSLKRLLDCGVSLGYLENRGELYSNSRLASEVLVPGKPGYMGNWLLLCSRWFHSFGELEKAIRTNRAVEDINSNTDTLYNEIFIKGMIDYAQYRGRDVLNYIDLKGRRHLLDVGCGPAVYSVLFCEQYPELQVTAIDLPHALDVAREYLADKEVSDRIRLVACNYLESTSVGNGYDVIFLSHILHQEDETTCLEILRKCFDGLASQGLLVVQAMYIDRTSKAASYALLHDLLTLLIFPGGKNHAIDDTIAWLRNTGFVGVRHQSMSLFNANSLVFGYKP